MPNRDRSGPESVEFTDDARPPPRASIPIGAPPRRRSYESMPALPPYQTPIPSAPPPPPASPKTLSLAPPRRPSDSRLPADPAPPSRPAAPPGRVTARPPALVADDRSADVYVQTARSSRPAAALDDGSFAAPPAAALPERFELDDLFTGAPESPGHPATSRPVAPRAPTAAQRSLSRAAPATGNSTYASLPPLRSAAPAASAPSPAWSSTPPAAADGETALRGSERAVAAHACMLALARASRSYLIYDPSNQAVRGFLDALRTTFAEYLSRYGELPLTVRPFELVLDDEVVYIERERERSLALKLFRDGVRKLTLDADTTWQELTKLLEILSIRFVGVRHDEDDLVTLLWKAGFHHISIESIEGFVPDDDDEGAGSGAGFASGEMAVAASARVPADFDLPAPELPPAVRVAAVPVSPDARAALAAECATPRLPQVTIDLVRQLLAVAADPTDPLDLDEVAPLVREARDFLLSDSRLPQLMALYEVLVEFSLAHPALGPRLDPLVAGFFDARALQKLVRSVPHDAPAAPVELKQLLAALPYDPVPVLLDLLGSERGENDRRILRDLLEGFLPARADVVIARLREVRGSLAADLLRALAERQPDAPSLVAATLISGDDDELQLEFLRLTASGRTDAATRGVLVHLLRSPSELLRVRTVDAIGEHREPGAFTLLRRHGDQRAQDRSSAEEMASVGRALAKVDPERALDALREWARPPGLVQRLIKYDAHVARSRAAVAGLAAHPSDEAEAALRELASSPTDAVRLAAEQALAARASGGAAPA